MYNLLVTYTEGAWEKGAYEYQSGRAIGGYGDPGVSDRYKDLSREAISELKTFPCLFVYEQGQGENAYLGWLTSIKRREGAVRIEFEIETNLPPLPRSEIVERSAELDIGRFALTHTHWAVKDIQLIPALIKAGLLDEKRIRRQGKDSKIVQYGLMTPISELNIRPSVFRVPSGSVETDLVSVMMPFEMPFDRIYNAVKAACGTAALRCLRADNIWDEAEVIQDIFSLIYRSRIVVCDFSGRNPNVFYEAGIAHTLGKTVIPIVQSADDIPFDLRHIRFIKYLNNGEGRETLTKAISAKLAAIISA
jgi:hypothetical protein